MQSHFLILVLFSLFVSVVFATLMRDDTRGQLVLGAKLLGAFAGSAAVLGWVLYLFPL